MSFHARTAVLLGTTILAGAISMPGAAWAQSSGTTAAATIETVIVTAEKKAEDVKNVPMSITVVGEKDLERLNAHSFEDYITTVPGMALIESSPTHTQLTLRGINAGGDGSTVGTLLDETPYGSSSALANAVDTAPNLDTFDIQRVEVLRGPQGTLYGASTLGGLLKFVTNAPDPSGFAAQVELGGTTLDNGGDGGDVHAMVNVPLGDDLAVRVVGFDQYNGGWIDDPGRKLKNINGVRSQGGRASVLYRLDDKVTVRLSATLQDVNANGDNAEDVVVVGGKIKPLYGDYQQQRTVNSFSQSRYGVYSGVIDWDLDWATLTSDSSYSTYHDFLFTDDTGVLGVDVQGFLKADKFTQEVRLASEPNSGPIDWLAGFYYTDETARLHQDVVFAPHGTPLAFIQLDSRYIETAGFVNATYHFTPDFDVSLGGRYSHNDQAAHETGLAVGVGNSQGDVFTWSAAAHYRLDDQTTLYARVAKGFRPGGPNTLPIGNPAGAPAFYGADSLIDYEGGVKTDLLDGTLSLDADAFYIDWSDIQLLTVINNTGVDVNGGSASSAGFEWDAAWRPIDDLTLGLSGAYTDAHLTANTPAIVGGLKGDPLPWSPKWSATGSADYRFQTGSAWTPYLGGTLRYIGERSSDFQAGSSQIVLPSYVALELRAGVDWENWELELYGKNLTDAKGFTQFSATGNSAASGAAATAALIAPRLVGIVLRARF
jgi:outer membrane receptor protein involved in Fe transport